MSSVFNLVTNVVMYEKLYFSTERKEIMIGKFVCMSERRACGLEWG